MSDYTKDPFDRCYDGAVMDAVWAANKVIGEKLGFTPREEYSVGNAKSSCLNPSHYESWPAAQKAECAKWIAGHKEYCEKNGYTVQRREYWPLFQRDWNALVEAFNRARDRGVLHEREGLNTRDIRLVWSRIAHFCGADLSLIKEWKPEERTTDGN